MTTVAVQRQAQRRRSPLVGYLLRRAGTSLLLLVGVTIVTFALTNLVPGDPVSAALGEGHRVPTASRSSAREYESGSIRTVGAGREFDMAAIRSTVATTAVLEFSLPGRPSIRGSPVRR